MSPIRWQHRPELQAPVLVTAFEGWNDAGDAASGATRWLADRHGAEQVGLIDCEEFFDFTATRPLVTFDDADTSAERHITWPDTEIWAAGTDGPHDLLFLVGHEPHLRWRTYCSAVTDLVAELDVAMVLTLGALLTDLPHTRPTVVTGTSDDPEMATRLGLVRSTYEGPTGIVGVLGTTLRRARIPTASLWASVPTYVSGAPSPKATLALVERCSALLGVRLPTTDLEIASAAYVRQLDELVAADDDTAAYVAGLEEAADDDPDLDLDDGLVVDAGPPGVGAPRSSPFSEADAEDLVEEVERFLRGD